MARVLNIKEVGWDYPNSVYCGRPSDWGNPFRKGEDGNRKEVIAKFETWLLSNPEMMTRVKSELKGKNLLCWCAPKQCHCDVLLRIANQTDLSNFL